MTNQDLARRVVASSQERKSIVEAKAAWQREQALQGHIAKIEGCLREKRISQGLKAVGAALREFPDNPALAGVGSAILVFARPSSESPP